MIVIYFNSGDRTLNTSDLGSYLMFIYTYERVALRVCWHWKFSVVSTSEYNCQTVWLNRKGLIDLQLVCIGNITTWRIWWFWNASYQTAIIEPAIMFCHKAFGLWDGGYISNGTHKRAYIIFTMSIGTRSIVVKLEEVGDTSTVGVVISINTSDKV